MLATRFVGEMDRGERWVDNAAEHTVSKASDLDVFWNPLAILVHAHHCPKGYIVRRTDDGIETLDGVEQSFGAKVPCIGSELHLKKRLRSNMDTCSFASVLESESTMLSGRYIFFEDTQISWSRNLRGNARYKRMHGSVVVVVDTRIPIEPLS